MVFTRTVSQREINIKLFGYLFLKINIVITTAI